MLVPVCVSKMVCVVMLIGMLVFVSLPPTQAGILDIFSFSLFSPPAIDHSRALEVIQRTSCWHRPIMKDLIEEHCLQPPLTDEGRYRLAIALANCHLAASHLEEVPCTTQMAVEKCTQGVPKVPMAFETYTTFFAHIDSLCFYMKKDSFHKSTSDAINALAIATIQSKETLIDFSRDMVENQQRLTDRFVDHGMEEDRRFKSLISGISNAQTLLQYLGKGQEELSQQNDKIINKTDEINSKQLDTLQHLGLVSTQLTKFEDDERQRFEVSLGRMLLMQQQMDHQSLAFNQTYTHLSTQVLSTHSQLNVLSSQLAADLENTRAKLSGLIEGVFYSIQNLHIDLISFTSFLFYPALFVLFFFVTSTNRTYNARLLLYMLLAIAFLFERALASGSSWALYVAHFMMCSMRYLHAMIVHIVLSLVQSVFGGDPNVGSIKAAITATASFGTVLAENGVVGDVQNDQGPYSHILSCPSCIIAQHRIISLILHTFTFASNNDRLVEYQDGLYRQLPSILLTKDEFVAMIEIARILFLFASASYWSWTILTYRDPIRRVEDRVDKVMAKLALLDESLYSFKQKMVAWSQALKESSRSGLTALTRKMSPILTPVLASFHRSTLDCGDHGDYGKDDGIPSITTTKDAGRRPKAHPLDATQQTLLQTPHSSMRGANRTKGNIITTSHPSDDNEMITPRSPKEARLIPITSNALNSPLVKTTVGKSRSRTGSTLNDEISADCKEGIDNDGDLVYIPSPPKPAKHPRSRKTTLPFSDTALNTSIPPPTQSEGNSRTPKSTTKETTSTAATKPTTRNTGLSRTRKSLLSVESSSESDSDQPEPAKTGARRNRRQLA